MAIDFYDPWQLKGFIDKQPKLDEFLLNRYVDGSEIEITEGKKVAVDYRFGSTQIAPFVADNSTGMALSTDGYQTLMLDVPNVGVKQSITPDELKKRVFGEDPANPLDIPERAIRNIARINSNLDIAVTARKGLMVADLLQTNSLTIEEKDEKTNATVREYKVDYLSPLDTTGSQLGGRQKAYMTQAKNRATFTAATSWAEATMKQIIGDLEGVVAKFSLAGIPVTDLVVTPEVWSALCGNPNFMDCFANKNYGAINMYGDLNGEQLADNAAAVAHLKIRGRIITLICYDGTYIDNAGTVQNYITDGKVILCAPQCVKFKYGSHVIIPQGSKEFVNITGERIPELYVDYSNSTMEYRLHSHPLAMPKQFASWSVGSVLS